MSWLSHGPNGRSGRVHHGGVAVVNDSGDKDSSLTAMPGDSPVGPTSPDQPAHEQSGLEQSGLDATPSLVAAREGSSPAPRRPSRLAPVAGLVLFVYALWWSGSLVAVVSHETFNAWQRAYTALAGRLMIGVVMVAALHHTFDGALRIVAGESEAGAVWAERLRPTAAFLTLALGLPAALVVVWPAVRGWGI